MLPGQCELEYELQEWLSSTTMKSSEFPMDFRARRPDVRRLVRILELAHGHVVVLVMIGGKTPCAKTGHATKSSVCIGDSQVTSKPKETQHALSKST